MRIGHTLAKKANRHENWEAIMIGQDYVVVVLFIIGVFYLIHRGSGHSLRR